MNDSWGCYKPIIIYYLQLPISLGDPKEFTGFLLLRQSCSRKSDNQLKVALFRDINQTIFMREDSFSVLFFLTCYDITRNAKDNNQNN